MVVAAGGNTGGQAATMVIRGMSLGELQTASLLRVAWKETRVGLLVGSLVGVLVAAQIYLFMNPFLESGQQFTLAEVALTVCLALLIQITISTLIGAVAPVFAKMANLDPAVVATPAITTIVDVLGLLIYFGLAKVILGI